MRVHRGDIPSAHLPFDNQQGLKIVKQSREIRRVSERSDQERSPIFAACLAELRVLGLRFNLSDEKRSERRRRPCTAELQPLLISALPSASICRGPSSLFTDIEAAHLLENDKQAHLSITRGSTCPSTADFFAIQKLFSLQLRFFVVLFFRSALGTLIFT